MRNVYVVAHAEATHHLDRIVGGWHDSQLTPAGHVAAEAVARALRALIPEGATVELYSSDLQRARQTATPISVVFDVLSVFDERLREKSYGEAEGRPQAWLDQRFIPPPATGERLRHDEGIPGAETKAACAERVYAAMDVILGSQCENQIIVTHGGAASSVIAAWIKMPVESAGYAVFRVTPASITVLHEDDYFHNRQVKSLNQTQHLEYAE